MNNLNEYNYFVIENQENGGVQLLVRDIRNKEDVCAIGNFGDTNDARKWVKQNHNSVHILELASFTPEYRKIYEEINDFFMEKYEEQKLLLLMTESGKTIENIVFVGISFDEEKENDEVVTLINHHFLVNSGEKVFMSHLIVFNNNKKENKEKYSQYDTVVPLFQNGSYFDNLNEYVVHFQSDDEFVKNIVKGAIGAKTFSKLNSNKVEERELAKFLQNIDYPKTLKYQTNWLLRMKTAYIEMLKTLTK